MKKRLTSFVLVLALSFSLSLPAFAVDDSDYYSLPSVGSSNGSPAFDWPVSLAVSHDGFLAEDSQNLARIMTDLTTTRVNTLKAYILDIRDALSSGGPVYDFLSDITDALTAQNTRGTLVWYLKDIDNLLSSIQTSFGVGLATEETLSKVATESTLKSFTDSFSFIFAGDGDTPGFDESYPFHVFWVPSDLDSGRGVNMNMTFRKFIAHFYRSLMTDSFFSLDAADSDGNPYTYTGPTLYRMIKLLQETLASEDDRKLADNYKENRDQAEQDFLNGQSGNTSLGKDDFSNASQVGGALHDTFNMGGASKVSDFVSGFGSAGEESLSWFSDTTSKNLDSVTAAGNSSSGVSTFSDDGDTMVDVDLDPYNMADISERYEWLEGVLE